MFNYKVFAKSDENQVEMDCRTLRQASDFYFMLMDCGGYQSGHVMDNRTGELYAHFERDEWGTQLWVAHRVAED